MTGMWRQGYRRKHYAICKCGHEKICHYSKDGHCIVGSCECQEFKPKGRQPFTNHRAVCLHGHSHDSGTEVKTCFDLHCQKLAGEIRNFRSHPLVDLPGPSGATVATYEVDFIVDHNDGTTEFIECKGAHLMREGQWPLKWKLLQDKHKGDRRFKFRVILG